jgi:hypothetical protein
MIEDLIGQNLMGHLAYSRSFLKRKNSMFVTTDPLVRYQINNVAGKGEMGTVFKTHDIPLRRDVAVKVILLQFASLLVYKGASRTRRVPPLYYLCTAQNERLPTWPRPWPGLCPGYRPKWSPQPSQRAREVCRPIVPQRTGVDSGVLSESDLSLVQVLTTKNIYDRFCSLRNTTRTCFSSTRQKNSVIRSTVAMRLLLFADMLVDIIDNIGESP